MGEQETRTCPHGNRLGPRDGCAQCREETRFAVGDRVRAHRPIVYAHVGIEIEEGTRGVVREIDVTDCASLVTVSWDGMVLPYATGVESLDPEGD